MSRIEEWQRDVWANGPLGGTPITAERLTNIEEGIEALQEGVLSGEIGGGGSSTGGIAIVEHGSDGSVARPADMVIVNWVGTATPVNAVPTDFWTKVNL